jgi:iron uptake system component EfeO
MAIGVKDLIEAISKEEITAEEDRYSRIDLWDFAGNVQGSEAAYAAFRNVPRIRKSVLASGLDGQFAATEISLAAYAVGVGCRPYPALAPTERSRMSAELAALARSLALLPAALRTCRPYDAARAGECHSDRFATSFARCSSGQSPSRAYAS